MHGIAAALPPIDGLACFNRMYLTVTEAVQSQVDAGFFADAAFMARLDVNFVNRFLAAVDAYRVDPGNAPRSWRAFGSTSERTLVWLRCSLLWPG